MPKRPLTNIEARDKLNSFGLNYDFSQFQYNGNRLNKSIVICPIHGRFEINYHNIFKSRHQQGLICKKCKNEYQRKMMLKHYHGDNYVLQIKNIKLRVKGYWTKRRCAKEALKYKTKRMFFEYSKDAYIQASNHGWLEEICQYRSKGEKGGRRAGTPITKWTKELCQQEALKYQTRRDFRYGNRNACEFAYNHKFLDEICSHMIKLGNRYNKCVYAYEFPDNHVYIGITCDFQRRQKDRKSRTYDTVINYINKTGLQPICKQLTDYVNVETASKLEGEYVDEYECNGWNILNKAKTGSIGGDILYWTYDKCIEEGLKFKTRSDFNRHSKGAYDACRRNNWLPDVYKHMKQYLSKPSGYWTKEKCIESAKKYPTRTDWLNNEGSAYSTAAVKGWLNECCVHMKRKSKFDKPFICTITVL